MLPQTTDDAAEDRDGRDLPVAYVRSTRTRDAWLVIVDTCPVCTRSHTHGGGTGREPFYGTRAAHCAEKDQAAAYVLRPAGGAA